MNSLVNTLMLLYGAGLVHVVKIALIWFSNSLQEAVVPDASGMKYTK